MLLMRSPGVGATKRGTHSRVYKTSNPKDGIYMLQIRNYLLALNTIVHRKPLARSRRVSHRSGPHILADPVVNPATQLMGAQLLTTAFGRQRD